MITLNCWPGQTKLLSDKSKLTHVYFGGIGHGKTLFGPRWQLIRNFANQKSKSKMSCVIAPNHKLLRHVHIPRYVEALTERGFKEGAHFRVFSSPADLRIDFLDTLFPYKVFFLSSSNYQAFVGWEFDSIWWDEPGFCPEEMRTFADQRTGRSEGVELGQTLLTGVIQKPNWYYDSFGANADLETKSFFQLPSWVEEVAPGFSEKKFLRFRENQNALIYHAASFENPTLKKEYFTRLFESFGWSEDLFMAHVCGQPCVMNRAAVYDFSEADTVGDFPVDCLGETLQLDLCFDFNVGQMSLLVAQDFNTDSFVVWENGEADKITEDACNSFMRAFPPKRYGGRILNIFGDSSGYARSAQLRTRDGSYEIIRSMLSPHYLQVNLEAPRYTVPQERRVMPTNMLLNNAASDISPKIYIDQRCKKLINSLRVTSWDDLGKIRKGSDDTWTHAAEAIDYRNYIKFPLVGRSVSDLSYNFAYN